MKRALVGLAAVALASGCWDFQKLVDDCADGGGVCSPDGGMGGGGGGGSTGGGGGDVGGGAGGGGGVTMDAGVDGGPLCPLLDQAGAGRGATLQLPDGGGTSFCFNGFQWENPLPQGNSLWTVHGTGPNDVWAAGDGNMVMHWNGTSWQSHQGFAPLLRTRAAVAAVHVGAGGGLLVGLGLGPYELVDGGWSAITPFAAPVDGTFDAIGVSPDGQRVVAVDLNGGVWSDGGFAVPRGGQPVLTTIGGVAIADDGRCIYTAKQVNALLLRTCDRATEWDLGTGSVAGPAWVQADGGFAFVITHPTGLPDGGSWDSTELYALLADGGLELAGTADSPVYGSGRLPDAGGLLVGAGWYMASLASPETPLANRYQSADWSELYGVVPFVDGGSWAVGSGGVMLREQAGSWQPRQSGVTDQWLGLLVDDARVLAVGAYSTLYRWPSGEASQVRFNHYQSLVDLAVEPDGGLLFLSEDGFVSLADGGAVFEAGGATYDLCTPVPGEHWAVGPNNRIANNQSGNWSVISTVSSSGPHWWDVDGKANFVVAVGESGAVARYVDGSRLVDHGATRPSTGLFGVWIDDALAQTGWVVGEGGVWRLSGEDLTNQSPNYPNFYSALLDVWGFDANDVWAVGRDGFALHYNGSAWTHVETGSRNMLWRVRGRQLANGQRELFMIGDFGTILRYRYTP